MKNLIILPLLMLMLVFPAFAQYTILPAPKIGQNTGFGQSTYFYEISTPQGVQSGTLFMQSQTLQPLQPVQTLQPLQTLQPIGQEYQHNSNSTQQPVLMIVPNDVNNRGNDMNMYERSININSYPSDNEQVRQMLLNKLNKRGN